MFSDRINDMKKSAMALVAAGMFAAAMACGGGEEIAPSAQNETESATAVVAQADATVAPLDTPTPFAARVVPLDTATPEAEDAMVDESATAGSDSAGAPEGDATPEPEATAMPDVMPAMNATPEAEATTEAVAVATAEPSATEEPEATVVAEATTEANIAVVATPAADNMDTVQEVNQCEIDGSRGLTRQQIDDRRATLGNLEITLCWDPDNGANYTMPFDAQNVFSDTAPDELRAAGIYRYDEPIGIPGWDGDAYCGPDFVPVLFWTEMNGAEPLAYSEYERITGGGLPYKDALERSKMAGLWLIPYAENAELDWDEELRTWLAPNVHQWQGEGDPGYCLQVADEIVREMLAAYQGGKCRLCENNR